MRTFPRITVLFLLVTTFLFHLTACLPGHMRVESGEEPGTLLLNMLTKNEALNLDRSLPKWAPIIDYWIIGIDDKNTDNSEAIIRKHLGHIPGQTVVVTFDGMGPTWTQLVLKGLELFPNATHGILSDADFTPVSATFDKRELQLDCSKHMYTIRSPDGGTVRNMDWIYRNIPGAKVSRRTHQSLDVPVIPGQRQYQTLVNIVVQEFEGGYQDRTGQKASNYLKWLHKDLEEMPGDPRTIYYLGHAHFDLIGPTPQADVQNGGPGKEHVEKSLEFFKWRGDIRFGYYEERWFALLKAGEICERFLADYDCSLGMWHKAMELDPERIDAIFYIGQHWRLAGVPHEALKFLIQGVQIKYPPRSLFQWDYMYECLRHLELGRAAVMPGQGSLSLQELKITKKSLKKAVTGCNAGTERSEVERILSTIWQQLKDAKEKVKALAGAAPGQVEGGGHSMRVEDIQSRDPSHPLAPPPPASPSPPPPSRRISNDAEHAKGKSGAKASKASKTSTTTSEIRQALDPFTVWQTVYLSNLEQLINGGKVSKGTRNIMRHMQGLVDLLDLESLTCAAYRPAARLYLNTFREGLGELREAFRAGEPDLWADWLENNMRLWALCESASSDT